MTLRDKFKTDPSANVNGVWFNYEANSDKSIPGFRLARLSVANPKYMRVLSQQQQEIEGRKLSDEEDEQRGVELFVDTVLLEWRNFQPEDDGKNVDFNRENALTLLTDPAWVDLKVDLRTKAANVSNYRTAQLDATAKN